MNDRALMALLANDPQLADLRTLYRRHAGLDPVRAVLGDANGIIYDNPSLDPSMVRVRVCHPGDDQLSPYRVIPNEAPSLIMTPGAPVLLNYNAAGELVVVGPDREGQLAAGFNFAANNASDANAHGYTGMDSLVLLLSHTITTPATDSMSVAVRAWVFEHSGAWYLFEGNAIDLTSYVPSGALEHRLVLVYIDTSQDLQAAGSTAQSAEEPLGLSDMQEAYDAASNLLVPVWFWRLETGMTAVEKKHSWLDARQFISLSDADSHEQNTDTKLDEGGASETTAAELRAHVDDAGKHREINDGGSGATDLWRSNTINRAIGGGGGGGDGTGGTIYLYHHYR